MKRVTYFNMVGSEVLKCDCKVTEIIDQSIRSDYYESQIIDILL